VAGAILVQLFVVLNGEVLPTARSVRQFWGRSALERSGLFIFGRGFAEYISFLRNHVPEDASVMLPPRTQQTQFVHEGVMQYFLYPRRVDRCGPNEIEPCIRRASGPGWYVLAVQGFPPPSVAGRFKDYVPFDDKQGLYVPAR
jgi:hypothetical protein